MKARGSPPKVAVIGRPNVGKSTLVNRLSGARRSLVGPGAGLTRDRVETPAEWRGRNFILADTGGLVERRASRDGAEDITVKVSQAALRAAGAADLILFVVDAATGIASEDLSLAKRLRDSSVPVIVAVNKADNQAAELASSEFWSLGLGEPVPVSALHGRSSGDLLDRIVEALPEQAPDWVEEPVPAIAIVGRPNVGKSSLFNRIVGESRAIVHDQPGTTRDSIDSIVTIGDKTYRFVDTAGLSRASKTHGVAAWSAGRTRAALERADLALLVLDSSEGATAQDQKVARDVAEAGVGVLLAWNKWDLVQDEYAAKIVEASVAERLKFVDFAPMYRTSAATRRGIDKLLAQIDVVLEARKVRVSTGVLNQLVQQAHQMAPPPRSRNKPVRVLYATQVSTAPPTFVLFSTGMLPESWLRYFERRLREEFGFTGNPIRLEVRQREVRARKGARSSSRR